MTHEELTEKVNRLEREVAELKRLVSKIATALPYLMEKPKT